MRFRIRSPQDFGAALVFILIGLVGIVAVQEHELGTAADMGPAYFPTWLSSAIVLLGLVLGAKSLVIEGPRIDPVPLRPICVILGGIVLFGWLLPLVGLALSTIVLTFVAAYARRGVNNRETLILGVGLAVFTAIVFVWALSQPLPLWWGEAE